MKFLKATVIIFGITVAGEFLNYLLPLPVPAGVYGLFLLLGLLVTGAVKESEVAAAGDFFLDIMPLLFIPAGVGLMNSAGEMKSFLIPLTVITAVSTVLVMAVTGRVAQYMIRRPAAPAASHSEKSAVSRPEEDEEKGGPRCRN